MRIAVVVLGDLGRSPRMLYHAQSLAARGVQVDLIGYPGALPAAIAAEPNLACHFLRDSPRAGRGFVTRATGRAAGQVAQLAWLLLAVVSRPDAVLVQVPPALPAVAVALVAARLRRARVVLDWHNLTSSMLALRLGARHALVRAVGGYERATARLADAHLCVSRAMADAVSGWRGTTAVQVFRDRPGDQFSRAPDARRMAWLRRVAALSGAPGEPASRIVVVPTSWGPDDDFDLLLEALERSEDLLEARDDVSIVIILTGLGPRRDRYKPLFERRRARRVHACAAWLAPEEYVELLGSADLGISLHRSASGLDLPMKICDLFGAGVPVCALDYGPCLRELVEPNVNGLLFSTADELAGQMCELLAGESPHRLARLGAGAAASGAVRWREGWTIDAWPVLRGDMAS